MKNMIINFLSTKPIKKLQEDLVILDNEIQKPENKRILKDIKEQRDIVKKALNKQIDDEIKKLFK
jgi:hypothetical protein